MTAAGTNQVSQPTMSASKGKVETNDRIARFRPRELDRLRKERYGKSITPDDDGLILVAVTLDTLALSADPRQRMANFLVLHCPHMFAEDREEEIDDAIRRKRLWTASALGNALKLTEREREDLEITTFRDAGISDQEMVARRKRKAAAAKRAERTLKRLHPEQKRSKPELRLAAILRVLLVPGDWVSVAVVCAELRRTKAIHFAGLDGPNLTSAVHDAVKLGLKTGAIAKRFVEGPKFKVAEICRTGGR